MYQNIYYQREKNLIHLWDDNRGYSSFPYTRYAYEKATNGEARSIYGDKLTKIYKSNKTWQINNADRSYTKVDQYHRDTYFVSVYPRNLVKN